MSCIFLNHRILRCRRAIIYGHLLSDIITGRCYYIHKGIRNSVYILWGNRRQCVCEYYCKHWDGDQHSYQRINYTRLRELEKIDESLLDQLRRSNEYKKHLARGCSLAVRHMTISSADAEHCVSHRKKMVLWTAFGTIFRWIFKTWHSGCNTEANYWRIDPTRLGTSALSKFVLGFKSLS